MIKKIIHIADVHIKNIRRHDEYEEKLSVFIGKCQEIVDTYGKDSVRIVIAGDLLDNKLDISSEANMMAYWFLKSVSECAKTIVIAGNHDFNMMNMSRLDPISMLMSISDLPDVVYADQALEYSSGFIEDDNVVWCLYSSFDDFAKPNMNNLIGKEGIRKIGLFHGEVKGSKTDVGFESVNGFEPSYFEDLDFCLMGHIHKRQCIDYHGTRLVYPGSLIQIDHGENLSGHGYLVWDVEDCTYEEFDLENGEYGFYTFSINDGKDIDADTEELINA